MSPLLADTVADLFLYRHKFSESSHAGACYVETLIIARIKSCAGPSCTNVAIGGKNSDRLYVTESVTGTVMVADISELK
jgi:hypothetical protein